MTSAVTLAFGDANHRPTEKAIVAALGPAAPAWKALFQRLHAEHPELTETWNYYTDGKSWLLKVMDRSRTIFWGLVERDAFRVTFYFADRLTPALLESGLSAECKRQLHTDASGRLRAVSLRFDHAGALDDALALVELKQRLK